MKTIKNAVVASAMVILSANVFAGTSIPGNYGLHHSDTVINTEVAQSKEAAYSKALEKLNFLKSASGNELSSELALSLGSLKEKNSAALEGDAYITVKELMNEQGNIVYKGLVNVSYSYSQAN